MTAARLAAGVSTAFAVSVILSTALARSKWRLWPRDAPNERSLHSVPTPRTGGLAILAGLAAALLVLAPGSDALFFWLASSTLFLACISFADDRRGLDPGLRLAAHALAASSVVWGGGLAVSRLRIPFAGEISLGGFGPPLSAIGLVWMANLFNFMDGLDGLAGAMTAIGGTTLGVVLFRGGDPAAGTLAFLLAGAAAGFLPQNAPPARIFMGDVGAVPIGFLLGATALRGASSGALDAGVVLLIFAPFVLDATVTLFRRALRGNRVWEAHRSHYYQRLVLTGFARGRMLLLECALMFACSGAALAWTTGGDTTRLVAVAFIGAAAVAVHALTLRRESRLSSRATSR